jgi:hypothetical protein
MGLGAVIGGALGFFGGGGVWGGLIGTVLGLAQQKQDKVQKAQTTNGERRVSRVRQRRAANAQRKVAMSFDGIGNENNKIPFQRDPIAASAQEPVQEQRSIFG